MINNIDKLYGIDHYVGTEYEIKLMAKKINKLVNQVNELTETVNLLKQKLEETK